MYPIATVKVTLPKRRATTKRVKPTPKRITHALAENTAENMRHTAPKKNKNYTSLNFPLLRYSDVLLMVAEAENEISSSPTTLAYKCLNDVRNRAGIAPYEEGSLSKEAFRQAVKDERAMELCFEHTRRHDLIRWGEYVKT